MFEKPSKQRSVLIGGAVIAAVSAIPGLNIVNCCCCAGIIFGGAFAVYLYQQEFRPDSPPLETSDALIVGLLSGLLGAVGATVLSVLLLLAIGPFEAEMMREFMTRIVESLADNGSIPADVADQMLEQMEDSMSSSESFMGIMMGFFFSIILYPIFGMFGGLIGYGIFRKKPQAPVPQV